ncbi:PsbP-related protein [uncultured Methanobrevibacter sp.]|uniref:PsbP-related protein n=1 Tax=uncultured Methanobrevibacter sp. TaxID=253161 RepID=UPI002620AD09|nr:PsbP-related protein [uncultured Methanobrevibacter sp.]
MKKCPECGNPSYDGAPVCGNCGYVFPKSKPVVQKRKSIFEQNPEQIPKEKPKANKPSNEPSVIDIIKEKKLLIGAILLVTLIVICGIFITGSHNNDSSSAIQTGDLVEYSAGNFSFNYPSSWEQVNLTDEDRENAIFFETEDNVTVEHYNVTSEALSLKEINQERIGSAVYNGDSIELLETISINDVNASNVIMESVNGGYVRYVSMLENGELYVFKVTGDSIDSVTSDSINSMINSTVI